jgi:hypothetical protein
MATKGSCITYNVLPSVDDFDRLAWGYAEQVV